MLLQFPCGDCVRCNGLLGSTVDYRHIHKKRAWWESSAFRANFDIF